MKVMWLTNIPLPIISRDAGLRVIPQGGWLTGYANGLLKNGNIELICVFKSDRHVSGAVCGIKYISFLPQQGDFHDIVKSNAPDIIHIFGTEFDHTLKMVNTAEKLGILDRVVVSIQGLVSVFSKHFTAFLPQKIVNRYSVRDILRRDNIKLANKKFIKRGENEIRALEKVKHVIGRTDFDRACVARINPSAEYHFCNETLRDSFYDGAWNYDDCEKHSIFVSQSTYPIKGLHLMLEAFADIKKDYPDAKLYTTGADILNRNFKERLKESSYVKYLRKLIIQNSLDGLVIFLGNLNEEQMRERFLRSNVFVCCSSIENSPNSVGEAMILGVPTVSSDVGGVTNMMTHRKDGFVYQADAPYMLAYYVKELFNNKSLAEEMSENARKHAAKTHDPQINLKTMIDIYEEILK